MDSALVVLPRIVVFGFSVLQPECQVNGPSDLFEFIL